MPGFSAAIIVAAGSFPCLADPWRRRAGEAVRGTRARLVADARDASRAFRAFFFISAEDSGTILEGTIILGVVEPLNR